VETSWRSPSHATACNMRGLCNFLCTCDHGRDRECVGRSAPQPGREDRLRGSEASQAASQNAHAAEKKPWPHPPVAVVCAGSTLHPPAARESQAGWGAAPPARHDVSCLACIDLPCVGVHCRQREQYVLQGGIVHVELRQQECDARSAPSHVVCAAG